MKKIIKTKMILTLIILIVILGTNFILAEEWPAYNICCEKTINGAWCQNSPPEFCDESFRTTPTSCEATSFCKLGCCVDSDEGLCMKNTPQKVCDVSLGTWIDDEKCNAPQCELGCCLLGDQASFITLTRCKRLASIYGLETNFKKDITSEVSCIDLAYKQDMGACVYEIDYQKTCKFTTRQECLGSGSSGGINSDADFFKDYLCSADELATECGPTTETICIEGKDEVYFKDSCGNPANIYDASKIYSKDPSYWKKIVLKQDSCNYNNQKGNVNSKTCGNCDYLQGSLCGDGNAVHGDLVCKDLNCYNTENGKNYKNGESWCIYQGEIGQGTNPVGSRDSRHVCIHGEETTEPCADFRNEVCIEQEMGTINGNFLEAACRINRWEDCLNQYREKDCLNLDKRDCFWLEGVQYDEAGEINNSVSQKTESGEAIINQSENKGILTGGNICLPDDPPGLEFWDSGNAESTCALGNSVQVVHFKTDIFGKRKCSENCEPLSETWVEKMNQVCRSLGDCGAHVNIAGEYTEDGYLVKTNGEKRINQGILGGIIG